METSDATTEKNRTILCIMPSNRNHDDRNRAKLPSFSLNDTLRPLKADRGKAEKRTTRKR